MYYDIHRGSSLRPAVETLIEAEILEGKGFLRPSENVPAQMFWKVVLRDAGFDPDSATFHTPVPSNVDPESEMAQYLREATRRGFLTEAEQQHFQENADISRLRAIEILVTTKALVIPRRTSKSFRDLLPDRAPVRAEYWPVVEAAYASGILDEIDIRNLRQSHPLKRHELVTWLYNYLDHGSKQSRLEKENPFEYRRPENPSRFQLPKQGAEEEQETSPSPQRRTLQLTPVREDASEEGEKKPTNTLRIEILSNEPTLQGEAPSIPDGDILQQIYHDVINRYRFSDQLTEQKKKEMVNAGIAAMVKAMGDRYSSYIRPSQRDDFQESLDGKFEGIGAYVEMIGDRFTITSPIVGSPAEEAGLLPGDVVTHVDGESIEGLSVSEIVDKIKGPAGSTVELTIVRQGPTHLTITVTRGKITVPAVTLQWKNSVPIIGLHQFNHETTSALREILETEILAKNPRGIVLDLRNNPGGFLSVAQEVVEFFTHEGEKIFSTSYKRQQNVEHARREGELADFDNIIVLQNKGTASASEILIGVLQDYGRARVVGSNSLGKGTVQSITNYSNGAMLKVTVAKWLTPNDRWIHETGIVPDIEVPDPTMEEKRKGIDRQLDRAVHEVLQY
ncbi:MAG: S41 family peptidase [Candidatus Gracilibacteria bacterium]|nr:S41 family peptidase [Candidatus Gracilibacteria bacterium]